MTLRIAVFFVLASFAFGARADEALKVMQTQPAAQAVIEGKGEDFFVRFDKPIDHIRSQLFVKQGGKTVVTLQPRFKTAPDVLYARAPSLAPGNYSLLWSVRSLEGTEVVEGEVAFTVPAGKR
jgi:methionine-rich copper-binding protein CopC